MLTTAYLYVEHLNRPCLYILLKLTMTASLLIVLKWPKKETKFTYSIVADL